MSGDSSVFRVDWHLTTRRLVAISLVDRKSKLLRLVAFGHEFISSNDPPKNKIDYAPTPD